MSDEGPTRAVAEWRAAYLRVTDLLHDIDDSAAATRVPSCPAWTVRDLLAHMVGLDADVLAGNEPDDHHRAWTQAQVDARAGTSVGELLAEWAGLAEPLQEWMHAHTTRPLADLVIHEQDLRDALNVPGGQDTEGPRMVRDRMLARFASRLDGLPPIALVADTWQWCSAGEPGEAVAVVEASEFDLARALVSRRSADQLRSWTTRGDLTPYLSAFEVLGPLPATP
ncbi:MAG TPA: maleylpyruvate isomerase family mycothiol-dependent enzyme [Nocardioidaceae bacterium]|nr:maleylpyruvate isomerase family mycothiol-dependent enzyme [Nocardioidaceae bacterium]